MARSLTKRYTPAEPSGNFDSEDLLRCGWNRQTSHRCCMPGSVKPLGFSHHLCRWHANIVLFSDPRFAEDEKAFNDWLETKRPTWIPVTNSSFKTDAWTRPAYQIFSMLNGSSPRPGLSPRLGVE